MDYNSVPPSVQQHLDNIERVFEFYSYTEDKQIKYLRDKVVVTAVCRHTSARTGLTVHYGRIRRTLFAGSGLVYTNNTAIEFHGGFSRSLFHNPL